MLIYVYGGTSSGKSLYGENILCHFVKENKDYIATMLPQDEEDYEKINRHQRQRRHKGFDTIEYFLDGDRKIPLASGGILECMSNFVANYLYQNNRLVDRGIAKREIMDSIQKMNSSYEYFVVIGNDVFSERDGESVKEYLELMYELHQWLCKESDKVIRVVAGIGIIQKELYGDI